MATTTTNLGLTQPDAAEGYDVAVFNNNAELIDNAVGALQNELGGSGGGLGDKVDAVKTDTEEIKSIIGSPTDTTGAFTLYGQIKVLTAALTTANQNIATLLTQAKGVKAIVNGRVSLSATTAGKVTIPASMNPERIIFLIVGRITSNETFDSGIYWSRSGDEIIVQANSGGEARYQIIEFY